MDEPNAIRGELQELIPWWDRRGVVRCGFNRKRFRNNVLIMAGAVVGGGVISIARGHTWSTTAGTVLGMAVLGMVICIICVSNARSEIEVDFERSEFRLHWFVYPLGFWDLCRKRLVTVPFDELRGVSVHSTKGGRMAYVGTRSSRFRIGEDIQHFDRIVQLAEELSGQESNAAMRRASALRIWIPMVIGGSVFCLLAWISLAFGWI